MELHITSEFKNALSLMEGDTPCIFLTGRAGTGKSTLLRHFVEKTKKKVVVLAPTGVAALNAEGQTIHSFFRFSPTVTKKDIKVLPEDQQELLRSIDTIVIDEVSMVRADLLDHIDAFLRLNGPYPELPFGGIQMIFIGDLYQLPPVVTSDDKEIFTTLYKTPYFFGARVMDEVELIFIELEKVFRQEDEHFIALLNTIRNKTATEKELSALNVRLDPEFTSGEEVHITLTATNAKADMVNKASMDSLPGESISWEAETTGDFPKEYYPTALELELKKGAQVMMLNNDESGRWVNGSMGTILSIEEYADIPYIKVQLEGGKKVEVFPHTWEVKKYVVQSGELGTKKVGSFTQYPLRLAFAITIHKAQGKTFERVILDIERGTFAHGQLYVALSRCRTFEGLVLRQPLKKTHMRMDYHVVKFVTELQYKRARESISSDDLIALLLEAGEQNQLVEIVYLKGKDVKSTRVIKPLNIREMEYNEHPYLGMIAYCTLRQEERIFNVERILEARVVG